MALTMNNEVMAVSMDESYGSDLQRMADHRGWRVLERTPLRQAMRQVIARQPRVVILQVSQATDRALQLIRMLHTGWRRVPLIVVAVDHNEEFEREARTAGVTCYLSGDASAQEVDQYVDAMLEPSDATSGAGSARAGIDRDFPHVDRRQTGA